MSSDIGQIPTEWLKSVVAILREGDERKVLVRRRALKDWQATFPEEFFEYSLRDALADALEVKGIQGKRYEMDEPGETYGFLMRHRGVPLYAKINLTEPDHLVIVYSAHRPLHGEQLT
jgi:hypothetical protein